MFGPTLGAPTSTIPASGTTLVSADLAGGFAIAALVSADLIGAYSISSSTTTVSADLAGGYSISSVVSKDLVGSYAVQSAVRADLVGSYLIDSIGAPMSFTPSAARTVTVTSGLKPFTAGDLWNMADPKRPRSSKDSDSTVDYSFNWTPWLLDVVDSIFAHQIILTEGLEKVGSTVVGSTVTVFVSAGNPSRRATLTCRITTNSTPPRVEDRTLYLDIEAA